MNTAPVERYWFCKDGIQIWEGSHNDGKIIPSSSSDDVVICASIPLCILVMVTIDCCDNDAGRSARQLSLKK